MNIIKLYIVYIRNRITKHLKHLTSTTRYICQEFYVEYMSVRNECTFLMYNENKRPMESGLKWMVQRVESGRFKTGRY